MTDYIKREDAIRAMAQYMMDTTLIDNPEASDRIEEWESNIAAPVMSTVESADVIEADKAQKEVDYWHDLAQSYEQTITKLTLCQTDVVEVVRCKDCKHYNEYENGEKIIGEEEVHDGWCMRWSGIENVNRHDYCSYGERAEALDIEPAHVRENTTAHKVIGGGEHDGATCWFECSRCGKTVDVNDKYCSECGARFEA